MCRTYVLTLPRCPVPSWCVQGQYDKSYVPAGEKLVDYGGHDEPSLMTADQTIADLNKKIEKRGRRDAKKKAAADVATATAKSMEQKTAEQKAKATSHINSGSGTGVGYTSPRLPLGMTLEEAENVPGVGGLGTTKPAWR